MGTHGSGKTSMRSIIFANYIAKDTTRLGPTVNVENSNIKFLGNLFLSLWDCGGQAAYMESYFGNRRDHLFSSVEVLIYVFDVRSKDEQKDSNQFKGTLKAIKECSPEAKIFCLVHKMDLIKEPERAQVFAEKEALLRGLTAPFKLSVTCFQTSIWDETLYKAWSSIVYSLIPNSRELEIRLNKFCALSEADEVVIFEKATFLVISHSDIVSRSSSSTSSTTTTTNTNTTNVNTNNTSTSSTNSVNNNTFNMNINSSGIVRDPHRFEKISNIIKQFKLSCSKSQSQFKAMEIHNSNYSAYISEFTPNTYIMAVFYDTAIHSAATLINIDLARQHFEPLITN